MRDIGLNAASDTIIWEYAKRHDYLSVSKDADFRQRSFLLGYPAKVVWIRRGNCSTTMVESILRNHAADIQTFEADPVAAFLILF